MTFKQTQHSILRISEAKTLELIDLYRQEECLWNTNCPSYKSKYVRKSAVERIAKKLNLKKFEPRHVMLKCKNLRNSYCQELKKISNSILAGEHGYQVYKPRIAWFSAMDSFLRPHLQLTQPKRPFVFLEEESSATSAPYVAVEVKQETVTPSEDSEVEDCSQMSTSDLLQEDQEEEEEEECQDNTDKNPAKKARVENEKQMPAEREPIEEQESYCSRTMSKILETVTSQSQQNREDPYDCFGKYIASLLRTMPKQRALQVQPRIIELITTVAAIDGESQITQSDV